MLTGVQVWCQCKPQFTTLVYSDTVVHDLRADAVSTEMRDLIQVQSARRGCIVVVRHGVEMHLSDCKQKAERPALAGHPLRPVARRIATDITAAL